MGVGRREMTARWLALTLAVTAIVRLNNDEAGARERGYELSIFRAVCLVIGRWYVAVIEYDHWPAVWWRRSIGRTLKSKNFVTIGSVENKRVFVVALIVQLTVYFYSTTLVLAGTNSVNG